MFFFILNEVFDLFLKIKIRVLYNLINFKFDFEYLYDEDYNILIGILKENFFDLILNIILFWNIKCRLVKNVIGIFLFKLKLGLLNGVIVIFCGMCNRC